MTQDNICYLSSTEESKEVWKESINSVVITRPGLLINFDISWWCWITQLEKLGMNMSTLRWYFFDSCITCLLCHFNSIVHWMMSMCRVKSNWHSLTRDFMLWEILWCCTCLHHCSFISTDHWIISSHAGKTDQPLICDALGGDLMKNMDLD